MGPNNGALDLGLIAGSLERHSPLAYPLAVLVYDPERRGVVVVLGRNEQPVEALAWLHNAVTALREAVRSGSSPAVRSFPG